MIRDYSARIGTILMCDVMIAGERFAYISEPARRDYQRLLATFEDRKAIDEGNR